MTDKERLRRRINDIFKYIGVVHMVGNNPPEPIEFEAYANDERPEDDGIRERRLSEDNFGEDR